MSINFKSILSPATPIHRTFVRQRQPIITDVADLKSVISFLAASSPGEKRFLGEIVRHFELSDYDKENAETRL